MPRDPQIKQHDSLPHARRSLFGIYEGLRILVPGLYAAGLVLMLYWTYLANVLNALVGAGPLLVSYFLLTVVIGMGLYALESPKRRRAFQENQPSRHLSTRARMMKDFPLLDDADAQRLYFYILNTYVPPPFHEKIFFFGMLYSVMTQIRRSSFWFAALASALALVELGSGTPLQELQPLILAALSVWIIFVVYVQHNKADRKMQENYQDQILWLEMHADLVDDVLKEFASRRRSP